MGGVVFAKDATLDIMVGGEAALIERVKPVLAALGRTIIPCGGTGTAHAMKALANYINACALINAIEAMTIGRKFGLDSKLMAEALIPMCAGRNHPIEKKVVPHVLTRKFGTGMAMAFIAKDVRIAMETAKSVGAFAPLGERVSELWSAAAEKIGPEPGSDRDRPVLGRGHRRSPLKAGGGRRRMEVLSTSPRWHKAERQPRREASQFHAAWHTWRLARSGGANTLARLPLFHSR